MIRNAAAAFGAVLLAGPAPAAVKSSTPAGFELESKAVVKASPAEAYAAVGRLGEWWNPSHTYSGRAENLSFEPRAGSCFCERTADSGTIEHGRIVYAQPGQALRLHGALGPLQASGVSGSLTWTFKAVPGGTEITQTYVVGGYVPGGAEKLAPLVDRVMNEQLTRLAARLNK
jgi:uncharacterized protein YndB with AHSA1/START domain